MHVGIFCAILILLNLRTHSIYPPRERLTTSGVGGLAGVATPSYERHQHK